jgi:hypothetical protein
VQLLILCSVWTTFTSMPSKLLGEDAAVAQYRPVSAVAVCGLILGIVSPAVFFHPVMWLVPAVGVLVSAAGLLRIAASNGELIGRRAAMIGLWLSVAWLVAGPTDWASYRWALRREARQFAQYWFDFLAQNRPREAHQLTLSPKRRAPLDDHLAQRYSEGSQWAEQLSGFLKDQLVSVMLAQGANARVEYIGSPGLGHEERYDLVTLRYAIHYPDGAQEQTAYALLYLHRLYLEDGRANWQIVRWDFSPS